MNIVERLEELLEAKDQEIDRLRTMVEELEQGLEQERRLNGDWATHTIMYENSFPNLPLPRLQITCTPIDGNWHSTNWSYCLVYQHYLNYIVYVPLGNTVRNGNNGPHPPKNDDLPLREGKHILMDSKHLGLRAFSVVENRILELSE